MLARELLHTEASGKCSLQQSAVWFIHHSGTNFACVYCGRSEVMNQRMALQRLGNSNDQGSPSHGNSPRPNLDPLEHYYSSTASPNGPGEVTLTGALGPSESLLLKFAPLSRSVVVSAPFGNIRIELPADENRVDAGSSVVVAASAVFNPYNSAAIRQQMRHIGRTPLEQECESVSCTIIFSDVLTGGQEILRRQHIVLGSALFTANHPTYSMRLGPVDLEVVLNRSQQHGPLGAWRTAA